VIGSVLGDLPLPVRWMVLAGVAMGIVGGCIGLIVGLTAYPATAWFAVIELGLPSALLGALLGLTSGAIAIGFRRS
jgi:hypothetical protein